MSKVKAQTKEAIDYLKTKPGYKRILKAIIDKYRKLGHVGGYIILDKLTPEEEVILAPLDYSIYQTKTCKVKVQSFANLFCTGRFEEIDFLEVLKGYKGEAIVPNRELKEQALTEREAFFDKLLHSLKSTEVQRWLGDSLREKKYGYQLVVQLYTHQKKLLQEIIKALDKALEHLENLKEEWLSLPLLASKVTRDAHYFDLNTQAGKLLLYVLSYKQETAYPTTLESMNEVLYTARIIKDEVSNTTICYGIEGWIQEDKPSWEDFWKRGQPLVLAISNLKEITHITAPMNKVYIIENPAVFTALLQSVRAYNTPCRRVALICTSGQLNTSSYMILDKLYASTTTLYYNGDFDPEGLQIAAKLKKRYGESLVLWHYEVHDYLKVKGEVSIKERLSKLQSIEEPQLKNIIECLQKEGVAGYQELLVEELIKDMEPLE